MFWLVLLQREVSPRTSGRLSHSSGPLTDSPPESPSEIIDELKVHSLPSFINLRGVTFLFGREAPCFGLLVGSDFICKRTYYDSELTCSLSESVCYRSLLHSPYPILS